MAPRSPSLALRFLQKEIVYGANSNYLTVEINCKISLKDYRLVRGIKKSWIVAIIVIIIKIIEIKYFSIWFTNPS